MAENNSSAPLKTADGAAHQLLIALRTIAAYPVTNLLMNMDAANMQRIAVRALEAQAAPAAVAVPKGWKLVPVEPTPEMLDAAAHASMQHLLDCIHDPRKVDKLGSVEMIKLTHASRYRSMLAATPALPATEDSSAGDLAEPTDAEIIALNDGERFFSMSESRFGKDVNPHTQYHTGEPGYLQFARAVLARWGSAPQAQPAFQQRVQPWMMECFGVEHAADRKKRNQHFLEEALELVQSTGWTQSEAHQLVDYVYGRPWGEPAQEVGGVMVTLAALCLANGLDMHQAGESELARIWSNVDIIRARQAAKPSFSPLPQAQPADAPIAYLQEADQHLLHRFIETTEDDESFDIGKDAVKRLANLGVVESCGFGRYGVTMFGYWVHEHYWHQNPSLPLKTNADRDREHRAAMAAAQEGGNASAGKDGAA